MRKALSVCAALALSLPLAVAAQSAGFEGGFPFSGFDSFISRVIGSVNIASSSSGGIVVSGGAATSGDSSASANVRSVIRSSGSGTQVRVDIRTNVDGTAYATSVARTIGPGERVEVRIATSTRGSSSVDADVSVGGSAEPRVPGMPLSPVPHVPSLTMPALPTPTPMWSGENFFQRFQSAFSNLFRSMFDFW